MFWPHRCATEQGMRGLETIFMVTPPAPHLWVRAVVVVAAFLLVQDAQRADVGPHVAPIVVAFWVNLLLVLSNNVPRMRRKMQSEAMSLVIVCAVYSIVLGLLVLASALGPHAVMVAWVAFFANSALMRLWLARCDVEFAMRYYDMPSESVETASTILSMGAVAMAVAAACLAALAHAAPPIAFVTAATFGWLIVLFLSNWLTVLVMLNMDDPST